MVDATTSLRPKKSVSTKNTPTSAKKEKKSQGQRPIWEGKNKPRGDNGKGLSAGHENVGVRGVLGGKGERHPRRSFCLSGELLGEGEVNLQGDANRFRRAEGRGGSLRRSTIGRGR